MREPTHHLDTGDLVLPAADPVPLRGPAPEGPLPAASAKIVGGALVAAVLDCALLALLAADGRGGVTRLVREAPWPGGPALLGASGAAIVLTGFLGWQCLARRGSSSFALLPALGLLVAGGLSSVRAVIHGAPAQQAALPIVIVTSGASVLVAGAAWIGIGRLYRADLPWTGGRARLAAAALALLVGCLPAALVVGPRVSAASILPLAVILCLGLSALVVGLPRALRLRALAISHFATRDEAEAVGPLAGALCVVWLASPLAVALCWRASVVAAANAPRALAGHLYPSALAFFFGPCALAVLLVAGSVVAVCAGPALRRVSALRVGPVLTLILGLAAAAAHLWAALATARGGH